MPDTLAQELAHLGRLTVGQLRDRYRSLFREATRAGNKSWLIKRIAWRLQALAEANHVVRPCSAPTRMHR